MKNKVLRGVLITIAIAGFAYGGFRLADYLTGTVRLKYSKIKVQKFSTPADETPLEE